MSDDTDHVLDPLVSLTLGVNEQRPAPAEVSDDAILHRVVVSREAEDLPGPDLDWVTHGAE